MQCKTSPTMKKKQFKGVGFMQKESAGDSSSVASGKRKLCLVQVWQVKWECSSHQLCFQKKKLAVADFKGPESSLTYTSVDQFYSGTGGKVRGASGSISVH